MRLLTSHKQASHKRINKNSGNKHIPPPKNKCHFWLRRKNAGLSKHQTQKQQSFRHVDDSFEVTKRFLSKNAASFKSNF